MKVGELIEELRKFDMNAVVMMRSFSYKNELDKVEILSEPDYRCVMYPKGTVCLTETFEGMKKRHEKFISDYKKKKEERYEFKPQ
jgi:hypothetical protein